MKPRDVVVMNAAGDIFYRKPGKLVSSSRSSSPLPPPFPFRLSQQPRHPLSLSNVGRKSSSVLFGFVAQRSSALSASFSRIRAASASLALWSRRRGSSLQCGLNRRALVPTARSSRLISRDAPRHPPKPARSRSPGRSGPIRLSRSRSAATPGPPAKRPSAISASATSVAATRNDSFERTDSENPAASDETEASDETARRKGGGKDRSALA